MPKRSRIGLDDLIAAAERGAAGLRIGKGRKVTDPTTEALTAECEALRLQVKLADEQAEHYKAEAIRLGELLKDAQAEVEESNATNDRLRDALVAISIALSGPPMFSTEDWTEHLAMLASQLRGERDHLQGELQRLMKEPDQPD